MKSLKSYNKNVFQFAERRLKNRPFLFWGFNPNNPLPTGLTKRKTKKENIMELKSITEAAISVRYAG